MSGELNKNEKLICITLKNSNIGHNMISKLIKHIEDHITGENLLEETKAEEEISSKDENYTHFRNNNLKIVNNQ